MAATSNRNRPTRKIRITSRHGAAGTFTIQVGDAPVDSYLFTQLPATGARRAFRVEKWQGRVTKTYAVCLDGKASTCQCDGFLGRGHCRHIEGLTALVEAGKLPAPAMTCRKPAPCRHANVSQHEDGELVCHDCGAGM